MEGVYKVKEGCRIFFFNREEHNVVYVLLAVNEDKTREVIGIYNKPTESAHGWGEMLNDIYERGSRVLG